MSDKSFLGTGWSFPPRFTSKGLVTVGAEADIHESLLILLSTRPGERVMQPNYGCGLKAHVFDSLNESSYATIRDLIEQAVLFFEPRIILERIEIDDSDYMQGRLLIDIYYRVRATNNRYNLVYPFYIHEGSALAG
ncbi:GPW/gp25 family protein [Cellvibrio japonicus]|uniref:GPW / gp25 family protein n=1 Tax=Cellvibrio japonicus (strain Ueda107) TaxID=498211 RepID=B3PHT5_CELJU|nr:GPW/gp25 family protein [Cellvibrio japonicus]ACE84848.1 GPW / gp25 family protein [Cellvibrio japonicus Ueda107]QEI13877.1 GPW/gp25 family protein [Cellvibrio japonicus]QEI17451.1 GPW/gp25 family protein [Cellvibrio japonicus]QEI21027.1 GPW/gp25 family protein [Cellvibrio japonicus]